MDINSNINNSDNKYHNLVKAVFARDLKLMEDRDPHYKKFSEYVHLYNDGKKDSTIMNSVILELKKLDSTEKAEIMDLFDTKIDRKKYKEKYDDVTYYKNMRKHFSDNCL